MIVGHMLVNLADVVDRLLRVLPEALLDLEQRHVGSIELLDKELEGLLQRLFLLLFQVFLSRPRLHLRIADRFKLFISDRRQVRFVKVIVAVLQEGRPLLRALRVMLHHKPIWVELKVDFTNDYLNSLRPNKEPLADVDPDGG